MGKQNEHEGYEAFPIKVGSSTEYNVRCSTFYKLNLLLYSCICFLID